MVTDVERKAAALALRVLLDELMADVHDLRLLESALQRSIERIETREDPV